MQIFFAILKTDSDRDYSVTLISRETLLMLVEQEFGAHIRKDCDNDATGIHGKTLNYLSTRYPLVRLYEYTVGGARMFLNGAHGMGAVYEMRAVELVEAMRDNLTRAIEKSIDDVRAELILKVLTRTDGAEATARLARIREVMDADRKGMMRFLE